MEWFTLVLALLTINPQGNPIVVSTRVFEPMPREACIEKAVELTQSAPFHLFPICVNGRCGMAGTCVPNSTFVPVGNES